MKRLLVYIFLAFITVLFAEDIVNIPGLSIDMGNKDVQFFQSTIKSASIVKYKNEWIYDGTATNNSDVDYLYIYYNKKIKSFSSVIQAVKCDDAKYTKELENYNEYFINSGFSQTSKSEYEPIKYTKTIKNGVLIKTTFVTLSKITVNYNSYLLIIYDRYTNNLKNIETLKNFIHMATSKNHLSTEFGFGFDFHTGSFSLSSDVHNANFGMSLNLPLAFDYFINDKLSFGGGAIAKIGFNLYAGSISNANMRFNSIFFMRTLFAKSFIPYSGIEYGLSTQYNFVFPTADYKTAAHISPFWSFGPYFSAYLPTSNLKFTSSMVGFFFEALFGKAYYFPHGTKSNPLSDSSLLSVNIILGIEMRFNIKIRKSF